MLTWLAFKKTIKKIWTWIKHYWYVPAVIVYTFILWVVMRRKDAAYKVLETRNSSYKAQIEAINNSHEEEIKKRNEIIEKYNDIIKKLEEKFEEDEKELDEEKKEEVKEMVEKYNDKPDELARMLADQYGFEYTE
jgi:uncharacterized protein HemX